MVVDEFEGVRNMDVLLSQFEGKSLRLIAHHRPPEPPQRERWGAGSCMLENTGHCPFGHHKDPLRVFSFNCSGTLQKKEGQWVLQNGEETLPLTLDFLLGHRSQVIVLKFFETKELDSQMDRLNPDNLDNPSLEELSTRLQDLRNLLTSVNTLKDKIDV